MTLGKVGSSARQLRKSLAALPAGDFLAHSRAEGLQEDCLDEFLAASFVQETIT